MTPELTDSLERSIRGLRDLDLGDAYEPAAARVLVDVGLHRLVVPIDAGGLGARMADACEVLLAIGAVDGSTALGFAMQVHVVGALVDSTAVAESLRTQLYRSIVHDRALVNNAATEEGGGSPARGAIPRPISTTSSSPSATSTWPPAT
jgi:alkylation response protein AidB-like acyl-CoA dehydrogenase